MLLRRSKSGDLGKNGRKTQALREAELERQRLAAIPPKLPEFANHSEQLSKTFGTDLRPESPANLPRTSGFSSVRPSVDQPRSYGVAVATPPVPGHDHDPYARTESMTHRGRYSYASSAVSASASAPRRVRRRKDPTPLK